MGKSKVRSTTVLAVNNSVTIAGIDYVRDVIRTLYGADRLNADCN